MIQKIHCVLEGSVVSSLARADSRSRGR